ncbi:MAG: GNAT family N-acetyltransferase [Eubacteriales bacterium]
MEIKEISIMELALSYDLPTVVKYYLTYSSTIRLYSLVEGEEGIGYVLLQLQDKTVVEIKYIYIVKLKRNHGMGKYLLRQVLTRLREEQIEVWVTSIENSKSEQMMEGLFQPYCLEVEQEKKLITYPLGIETKAQWIRALQPMQPLIEFIRNRMLVECVNIENASETLMNNILERSEVYFDTMYNPKQILCGIRGEVDKKCSCIAHRNEEPVAISIILKTNTTRAIFELVVVGKNQKNHGVFILPVTSSVQAMEEQGYESFSLCIYKENNQMQRIEQQMLGGIDSIVKRQVTYKIIEEK